MFRPAGDSDDDYNDYDGFDDGYDRPPREVFHHIKTPREELDDMMYRCVLDNNITELEEIFASNNLNPDDRIQEGYNLLMYACKEAHPDLVRYLIDKGASVNIEIDSHTPLMMACSAERDSGKVADVVKQLLDKGAVINLSNIYGDTPMIFACQNGHTEVVRMLIKDASLDATNNVSGNSAIFYAIEKNYFEIVKMLIENGASCKIPNRAGYFPKAVAEMHGFSNIIALFPKEETYRIPDGYLGDKHYIDLVPGILGKPTVPPYFYRISEILTGLKLEELQKVFAKAQISLPQFLTMTQDALVDAGVELPIKQKKVLHGLLKFHQHKWSKDSVQSDISSNLSFYDTFHLYTMFAGHLQHLVVLRCSLVYVMDLLDKNTNSTNETINSKSAVKIIEEINKYVRELEKMYLYIIYLRKTLPCNVINEISEEKANTKPKSNLFLKKILKYSSIIGAVATFGIILRTKLH